MACMSWYYPWYQNTIPEWKIELTTDNWDIIISNKRVVWMPQLEESKAELIRYIVPWNFFRLTSWTPQQRLILTKVLWIDSSILEDANNNLKRLKAEQKEFDNKKEQITDDIIRLEDSIEEELIKPEEVKQVQDNSQEIINEYNSKVNEITSTNNQIRWRNDLAKEDYSYILIDAQNNMSAEIRSNESDILRLSNELNRIKDEAEKLKTATDYNCKSCWTLIKVDDTTELINQLRVEYKEIFDKLELLKSEKLTLESSRRKAIERAEANQPKLEALLNLPDCLTIEAKAVYVWIKYTKWNTEEYSKHQEELKVYNDAMTRVQFVNDEIKIKSEQLKSLNSTSLEKDIKRFTKIKEDFNKMVEEKVKETWLDIKLFKVQKNWVVKETFEIYDKEWNMYWATSEWNNKFLELLIAKLFVKFLWLDFILVDWWESIWNNLRKIILEEIWDLQIIVTEVSKEKKITLKDF